MKKPPAPRLDRITRYACSVKTCGDIPVIEHNGDFYSCDHFVLPEHRLGNIRQVDLADLLEHPGQLEFGRAQSGAANGMPDMQCAANVAMANAPKKPVYQGRCGRAPAQLSLRGLQDVFLSIAPHLFRQWPGSGGPKTPWLRRAPRPRTQPPPRPGATSPCPCGSGKKYKTCCMNK